MVMGITVTLQKSLALSFRAGDVNLQQANIEPMGMIDRNQSRTWQIVKVAVLTFIDRDTQLEWITIQGSPPEMNIKLIVSLSMWSLFIHRGYEGESPMS